MRDLGALPEGWRMARLGDLVKLNRSNWDPSENSAILILGFDCRYTHTGRSYQGPQKDFSVECSQPSTTAGAVRRHLSENGSAEPAGLRTGQTRARQFNRFHGHSPSSLHLLILTVAFVYHHVMTHQSCTSSDECDNGTKLIQQCAPPTLPPTRCRFPQLANSEPSPCAGCH